MVPTNLPSDLISITQAVRLTGRSDQTFYSWVRNGHLPHWRVGRNRIRISKADVIAMTTPQPVQQGDKDD